MKNAADKGKCLGAFVTDLSKTFDCPSHELLANNKISRLWFDLVALKLFEVTYVADSKVPKSYSSTKIVLRIVLGRNFIGSTGRVYSWSFII